MMTWLHKEWLQGARAEMLTAGTESAIDRGCGDGELCVRLVTARDIVRRAGNDL